MRWMGAPLVKSIWHILTSVTDELLIAMTGIFVLQNEYKRW